MEEKDKNVKVWKPEKEIYHQKLCNSMNIECKNTVFNNLIQQSLKLLSQYLKIRWLDCDIWYLLCPACHSENFSCHFVFPPHNILLQPNCTLNVASEGNGIIFSTICDESDTRNADI